MMNAFPLLCLLLLGLGARLAAAQAVPETPPTETSVPVPQDPVPLSELSPTQDPVPLPLQATAQDDGQVFYQKGAGVAFSEEPVTLGADQGFEETVPSEGQVLEETATKDPVAVPLMTVTQDDGPVPEQTAGYDGPVYMKTALKNGQVSEEPTEEEPVEVPLMTATQDDGPVYEQTAFTESPVLYQTASDVPFPEPVAQDGEPVYEEIALVSENPPVFEQQPVEYGQISEETTQPVEVPLMTATQDDGPVYEQTAFTESPVLYQTASDVPFPEPVAQDGEPVYEEIALVSENPPVFEQEPVAYGQISEETTHPVEYSLMTATQDDGPVYEQPAFEEDPVLYQTAPDGPFPEPYTQDGEPVYEEPVLIAYSPPYEPVVQDGEPVYKEAVLYAEPPLYEQAPHNDGQVVEEDGVAVPLMTATQDFGPVPLLATAPGSQPTPLPFYMNAGGGEYTDTSGRIWAADLLPLTPDTTFANIHYVRDPLFQTERYGNIIQYDFSVPNGDYEIVLHFAEIYWGAQRKGARVFDVFIEGDLEYENLDIFSEVGGYKPLKMISASSVSDGILTILLSGKVENPKISALEIRSVASSRKLASVTPAAQEIAVTSFVLVNADTNKDIYALKDNAVINLDRLPTKNLSIRAETSGGKNIGIVEIELGGTATRSMVENYAFYSFPGDPEGDYLPMKLGVGKYTVTATPYSEMDTGGTAGTELAITFFVVSKPIAPRPALRSSRPLKPQFTTPPAITRFVLVNADTDKDIEVLEDNAVIALHLLPTKNLNIRAETSGENIGGVVFVLEGPTWKSSVENEAPYSLAGDVDGDYLAGKLEIGDYTLIATPFSETKGLLGTAWPELAIHFSVTA